MLSVHDLLKTSKPSARRGRAVPHFGEAILPAQRHRRFSGQGRGVRSGALAIARADRFAGRGEPVMAARLLQDARRGKQLLEAGARPRRRVELGRQ